MMLEMERAPLREEVGSPTGDAPPIFGAPQRRDGSRFAQRWPLAAAKGGSRDVGVDVGMGWEAARVA